jgi:hypothetical protein
MTIGAIDAVAMATGCEMRRRRRSTYAVVNANAVAPVVWPLGWLSMRRRAPRRRGRCRV